MATRKLTDAELREWGENLSNGVDDRWEGITPAGVLEMMRDTAGNEYDAGAVDWDFDKPDAVRLLKIMVEQ
uniref:Uncharacterized protein n=1 Tax=viral metagenome TaxID=1070528 RepID=A0A6M3J1P5_9ZZZZ